MPERFYQVSMFLLLLWFLNTVDPGLKIAGVTNKEGHCSDEKERGLQGGILSPLYWERKSISPSSFLCLLFLLLVFKSLVLRRRLSVFPGDYKGVSH